MGLGVTSVSSVPSTVSEGHWPSGWGRRDKSHAGQIRDPPEAPSDAAWGSPVGGRREILLNYEGALRSV